VVPVGVISVPNVLTVRNREIGRGGMGFIYPAPLKGFCEPVMNLLKKLNSMV
jgi:hypothetical protein